MTLVKAAPALGTLGNYQLLEEIGRGNFGLVYRARHWHSGQEAAVKIIPATLSKNAMLLKRFKQECLLAARIEHPNTVRVLEYSFDQEQPFLVMELIEGVSLGERVERHGRIPEAEAIRLVVQACQGLHQIHSMGLLHRDIKPDNLLVDAEGVLKIADLGLAKDVDSNLEMTRAGTGLGTPNFIAPEQFRDAKTVDRRCDIYGLGATLYQMITGVLPFGGGSPVDILMRKMKNQLAPAEKIVPGLSERTRTALTRALHLDQKQRFGSCWEFAEALTDIRTGLGADFEQLATGRGYWYLLFRDKAGRSQRATSTSAALARALTSDRFGDFDSLRLARSMAGPYRRLEKYPELLTALTECENNGRRENRSTGRPSSEEICLSITPIPDPPPAAIPFLPEIGKPLADPSEQTMKVGEVVQLSQSTGQRSNWFTTALVLALGAAGTFIGGQVLLSFWK